MKLVFILSVIFGNASVYDPYWSVQPPFILAAFACGRQLDAVTVLLLVTVFVWGVGLASFCLMPDKPWLLAGAAANTVLFFSVSIPMAEGRQSKKAGYAEYKAETRMLLPIKRG